MWGSGFSAVPSAPGRSRSHPRERLLLNLSLRRSANLSASDITERGATLGAEVDPGAAKRRTSSGSAANAAPAGYGPCDPTGCDGAAKKGRLRLREPDQTLSVTIVGLQPGYSYDYWVVATNPYGTTESRHRGFSTAPYGACPEPGARTSRKSRNGLKRSPKKSRRRHSGNTRRDTQSNSKPSIDRKRKGDTRSNPRRGRGSGRSQAVSAKKKKNGAEPTLGPGLPPRRSWSAAKVPPSPSSSAWGPVVRRGLVRPEAKHPVGREGRQTATPVSP